MLHDVPQFFVVQKWTTSDPWTLFIEGQEQYSSDLGSVMSYLRMLPPQDQPKAVTVALETLADSDRNRYPPIYPTIKIRP